MALQIYKINTVEVGSTGATTIAFTSIPQGYTDLKIVISARDSIAADFNSLTLNFNGSTANFAAKQLAGTGSSAISGSITNAVAPLPGSTTTANSFSNVEIYITNYTTSTNKSYSWDGVLENNATGSRQILGGGLWSNTAAITSITIGTDSTAFVQYTTATLYGIL